jgi:hypothetical protein
MKCLQNTGNQFHYCAVFSNYFVNLLAGCIVCATIYLALAGVWKYHSMKAVFPIVAIYYEGSNPCE